ncbi:hypothetical protein, partial [Schaalia turicensis]|uniref:hypothetical protein n=1 Tax=Schaalia turicensis TaxID=131111 RepID=UPI001A9C6E83
LRFLIKFLRHNPDFPIHSNGRKPGTLQGAKLPVINAQIACARTMLNTSPNAMASFFADVNLWRLLAHSARDRGGVRSR